MTSTTTSNVSLARALDSDPIGFRFDCYGPRDKFMIDLNCALNRMRSKYTCEEVKKETLKTTYAMIDFAYNWGLITNQEWCAISDVMLVTCRTK